MSGEPGPFAVLLDLVLPRPCPGCGGPEPWCPGCAATLSSRARSVALPGLTLDGAADLHLPPVMALARYAGPVRAAIIAGKERGRRDLPARLGCSVGTAMFRLRRIDLIPPEVWIVPAPSRRSAARARGGDPVRAMAESAASTLAGRGVTAGVAPCLYTAGRARDSVGLDASGRAANLAGRIRLRTAGRPPPGVPVVLLDDVITTGATVVASLRTLSVTGIEVKAVVALASAAPWRSVR
ncbi:Predicted amidophosphoribosyltransferases [Nakamurella panacisegetis]|uniref:Predicted amidophosphoribosyltransferases n=1 Tax=Nakamurella panacisegetis TaxID=1090615 RepID=A0A1H0I6Z3_9ACTN|nr:ComF family protein [Nakamurella panacisegetis]SDO27125.1 Predicted amidophosphoribosyltransferases [Nakamurella panacisegetis]